MNTLITAHAGAEGTQANSLDSLERLLRCGSDLVELDVRGRGDQLVLHHDRLAEGLAYPALAEAGVHNITTRQPLLALRLRAQIQQAR